MFRELRSDMHNSHSSSGLEGIFKAFYKALWFWALIGWNRLEGTNQENALVIHQSFIIHGGHRESAEKKNAILYNARFTQFGCLTKKERKANGQGFCGQARQDQMIVYTFATILITLQNGWPGHMENQLRIITRNRLELSIVMWIEDFYHISSFRNLQLLHGLTFCHLSYRFLKLEIRFFIWEVFIVFFIYLKWA